MDPAGDRQRQAVPPRAGQSLLLQHQTVRRALPLLAAAAALCARSGATGDDWPSYGGTYSAWRYSSLDQVNRGNVQKLAPAWVFQTGDYENGLQATPIAAGGVLYLS